MKILAIHAHPDDVEFLAAGTLYLLSDRGHKIHIATVANGDKGSPDRTCTEIAAVRREEAKNAAAIIGAEYSCLGFSDCEIYDTPAARRKVTEFLRQARPDIILTASPQDYFVDHEMTSFLVRNATFFAPIRLFECDSPPLDRIPYLYYMDPAEGTNIFGQSIKPEFYVDITTVMPVKEKMLACHESQRDWLRKHHQVDQYLHMMHDWSATRGREIGCQYAEGFRQHRGHAYPHDNILGQLLSKSVISE